MSIYIKPILTACYVFPILAALFTLPYIIHQYRKYGSLLILRVIIVYTFIFYMMTSYFMTILPLPPIDSVTPSSASLLLVPFDALMRLKQSSGFSISDSSTYINVLKDPDLYQILFNIALLLPFGVYLRYYFNRKWYQVLLLSFLYSLFFELTQLSGLYGIYPYPYRFFEIDDLICNTLGGMLGFWLTPAFSFFLPNRERLDQMSYKKGENVSIFRRLFAFLIDQMVLGILFGIVVELGKLLPADSFVNTIITQNRRISYMILCFICISIVMISTKGYTIGKALVKINVSDENKNKPPFYKLIARTFFIYILAMPYNTYVAYLINLFHQLTNKTIQFLIMVLISVFIVLEILFIFHLLRRIIHHDSQYLYDRMLHLNTFSKVSMQQSKVRKNEKQYKDQA